MNAPLKIMAAAACGLLLGLPAAQATDESVYVFSSVGSGDNDRTINPRELTLQVGQSYQFVVSNPSTEKHVIAAPELAQSADTREIVAWAPRADYTTASMTAGIPLQPGQMVEWTFTPLKEGSYKFGCHEEPHASAGMQSTVKVVAGNM